jgi:hypothetical protein
MLPKINLGIDGTRALEVELEIQELFDGFARGFIFVHLEVGNNKHVGNEHRRREDMSKKI